MHYMPNTMIGVYLQLRKRLYYEHCTFDRRFFDLKFIYSESKTFYKE